MRVTSGEAQDSAEFDDVVSAIRRSGAVEQSYEVAESFVERSKERIADLPDPETRDLLSNVADFALSRLS
jgi:geranylgeranyl pyrophosphate synthase